MNMPKPGDPVRDDRFDATKASMTAMRDNIRRLATESVPGSSVLSDQDLMNAYSVAYFTDDETAEFILIVKEMLPEAPATDKV